MKLIFITTFKISRDIIIPAILVYLFLFCVWSYMSNIKEAIIDILKIFPFTIIILYLVMQKVTKRFKLYTQILRIEYPISFFMKPKEILLNEVDYIKFDENSGARKVPFLVIYYKNETGKNKQKISFSHDYKEIQILINKIRELGVKVEVISNVMWK